MGESPGLEIRSGDCDLRHQPALCGRSVGYAGPWNRPSGEAQEKYIIVDMFARAARGEDPKAIAAWGQKELENVYGA